MQNLKKLILRLFLKFAFITQSTQGFSRGFKVNSKRFCGSGSGITSIESTLSWDYHWKEIEAMRSRMPSAPVDSLGAV